MPKDCWPMCVQIISIGLPWLTYSKSLDSLPRPAQIRWQRWWKQYPAFHPCSGITEQHDARVPIFICHTGTNGGGACSVTAIAMELFKRSYGSLSFQEKLRVDKTQTHKWSFRFDRHQFAVCSTACKKMISILDNTKVGPHTCQMCLVLCSKDQRFKSGLRVATSNDENYQHLNEKYQGKSDSERYVKTQGLQALFEDKVYLSLIFSHQRIKTECFLLEFQEHDLRALCTWCVRWQVQRPFYFYRFSRCYGQFMRPRGAWCEPTELWVHSSPGRVCPYMCHHQSGSLSATSKTHSIANYPKLSVSLCDIPLGLLSLILWYRIKRARMPRFPTTICDQTYALAANYVDSINYRGPMALSCDDTKLHPGLRTYWDPSKECHFLIGTTGEPIAIPDVKQIWELVASAKNDTATKVCLSVYLIVSIDAHNSLCIIPAQNLVLANSFAWDVTCDCSSKGNSEQSKSWWALSVFSWPDWRTDCMEDQDYLIC